MFLTKLFRKQINYTSCISLTANNPLFNFARAVSRSKSKFAEALNNKKEAIKEPFKEEDIDEEIENKSLPEDFPEETNRKSRAAPLKEVAQRKQDDLALSEEIQMDKETQMFIKEKLLYKGYDPEPNKLVQRPEKDVVWGLGGELLRRRAKSFEKGKMPEPDDVIMFLELEQAKDISLLDMEELGRTDLPRWGIILTGYSSRHLYRMGKNLLKAFLEAEIPDLNNPPKLYGRKDDDWILVECKDIMVHMFTEEAREDIDLEYKWRNPVPEEEIQEIEEKMYSLKKKWKREGARELKRKW